LAVQAAIHFPAKTGFLPFLQGAQGIDSAESYWRNRRPKGQADSGPVESAMATPALVESDLFGAELCPSAPPKARTEKPGHAPRQLAFDF
jgi:hypothetical protein